MSDDDAPCCGNCPYWSGHSLDPASGTRSGECRRSPPTIHPGLAEPGEPVDEGWFPVTTRDVLCGEHPDHPARRKIADLARPLIP